MKSRYVKLSRESEKQIIIQDLNRYGVFETMKGDELDTLDYYALRGMLAIELAVRA